MTEKKPVFDIGDTLMPSYRIQRKLMGDVFRQHGTGDPPEFRQANFRIYTAGDVKSYLEDHGLGDADPVRVIDKYKDRERRYMEENGVFRFLKNVSREISEPGFISDNTIEGKKWMEKALEEHGVKYSDLVVSEEVGVEKPSPEIFQEFLDRTGRPGDEFVYFGNNLNRDPACRDLGIDFVLVTEHRIYGDTDEDFETIDKLDAEKVRKHL